MTNVNILFRNRLDIPLDCKISFENLHEVLERTAKMIPFENMRIMAGKTTEITEEYLVDKLFVQKEGGLCYELNAILHLFLKENGFDVVMVRGIVYDQMNQQWNKVGQTHVTNLIYHNGQPYLVDTGFGGNLPLKPVPLNGEMVESQNGEFRVEQLDSEYGDYLFYMKLKFKDHDWKIGYAFDSKNTVSFATLNEVQKKIVEHPESPFNKKPLLTRLTDKGNIILSENSFVEWADGDMKKEEIDEEQFQELKKVYFG